MNLKLPNKIKWGGHLFDVLFPCEMDSEDADMDYGTKVFRIDSKNKAGELYPASVVIVNLLHEIFHGIDDFTGRELFELEEGGQDEGAIDAYAETTFMLIADNFESVIESLIKSGYPLKELVDRIAEKIRQ